MNIKVSDNVKGKISIPSLFQTLKAGQEVTLTKEQFESIQVQNLLKNGIIFSEQYKPSSNKQFRNTSKNKIKLPWGVFVAPNQVFEVEDSNSKSFGFRNLIDNGFISEFVVEKVSKTQKSNKSKELKKDSTESVESVASKKLPKGVYVHDPERKKDYIEHKISEIDSDLNENNFVDKKQTKEKLLRMQKNLRTKG